jgi:hypothetical protein
MGRVVIFENELSGRWNRWNAQAFGEPETGEGLEEGNHWGVIIDTMGPNIIPETRDPKSENLEHDLLPCWRYYRGRLFLLHFLLRLPRRMKRFILSSRLLQRRSPVHSPTSTSTTGLGSSSTSIPRIRLLRWLEGVFCSPVRAFGDGLPFTTLLLLDPLRFRLLFPLLDDVFRALSVLLFPDSGIFYDECWVGKLKSGVNLRSSSSLTSTVLSLVLAFCGIQFVFWIRVSGPRDISDRERR